jgi:hypothetical protein
MKVFRINQYTILDEAKIQTVPEREWNHEVLPHQADKRQSAIMACMAVLHIMQDDTAR